MDPLTITATSGLRSRMESLELLANNLANAGTPGYKKDGESYSLYLSSSALDAWADLDPVTAALPVIDRNWTDFAQGLLSETGNPLDLAISGQGFFTVEGPNGPLYTRNGQFRIGREGFLMTADGKHVVLEGGGVLQIGSTAPLTISTTGVITQGGEELGRLAVVEFADAGRLSKKGSTYYETDQAPVEADSAEILQGKIEGSNVNTPESAMRLLDVLRQFEMLTKAVQVNSEMNRKAIEEVARVGS